MSVSKYFAQKSQKAVDETEDLADRFISLENNLVSHLIELNYGENVKYIYNPLDYASDLHKTFLKKFLNSEKKVLFLGINPGPWGMCQTGIPFGEINVVRDFLQVDGIVLSPEIYHPSRPINGLNCQRSEVSGKRLWDLIIELSEENAYNFFKHCFIHNYFPFALMDKTAKNITPCDLKVKERKALENICDESLNSIIRLLGIETVVAIGKYAEKKSYEVIVRFELNQIKVVTIPHPSPRSVGTAEKWKNETLKQLRLSGIVNHFK